MTIENKLRSFILSKYKSMREFSQRANLPYTTIQTILTRGVENASVGNIIKICRTLHISADALSEGRIEPYYEARETDTVDLGEIVNETKAKLSGATHVTINGHDIDIEYAETVIEALDVGYELAKRKIKAQQKP